MRTKFERVVLLTAFGSLVVPSVACIAAETWASQILNYFGFVYQTIAQGMAAYEVNNLDVQTFQGPGFLRRMGWRPHPLVHARSAGPTIDLVAGGTGSLEWPPTEDVLERLRRLEVHVAALKKVDQELERAVKAEVEARKQGDDALKSELQTAAPEHRRQAQRSHPRRAGIRLRGPDPRILAYCPHHVQ
jgi:hypothetical protein